MTSRPPFTLKTAEEIAIMREAGRITARALQAMREAVRPGVNTQTLNDLAEQVIRDHGATPAFLNYRGLDGKAPPFPSTITACINEELVHGIPSPTRILKEGDIISLDTACFYQGYIGDAAFTVGVGEINPQVQRLLDVTEKSLYVGINASLAKNTMRDVAQAIQRFVEGHGYSVARGYTGHGIGKTMHEEPEVPNWWSRRLEGRGLTNTQLRPGMTYALEPMVIAGRGTVVELSDGWTVATKDRSLCAHFEHSIVVTEGEPQILTLL